MCNNVAQVDWSRRRVIGGGGFAVVYRIKPNVVAKVGAIAPDEVAAQRHFAVQRLALPVLDYRAAVELPEPVGQEVCPVHGLRQEILPEGYACTCGHNHGVLLMPEADLAVDTATPEYQAFILGFSRDCYWQLGRYWDARPANVARYQGRLIALDFGEEEG